MSGSVLVVDDDPTFRSLALRILSGVGLLVVGEAPDAATAIAAATLLKPDAVLVDIGLPDRDGLSLARELVQLPWSPRVVLTSTDAEAATLSEVRRTGAAAFIPKPELPDAALERLFMGPAE